MSSVETYNLLPCISKANENLREQLGSSGITLDQHLADLAQLFSETGLAEQYTVWLRHAHFRLQAGERMVTEGNIMEPTSDALPNVIVERWGRNGEELEYRVGSTDARPEPLPADLLAKFNDLNDAKNIDVLGLCRAPSAEEMEKIRQGYAFLERVEGEGRKHIISTVLAESLHLLSEPTFASSWVLVPENSDGTRNKMVCSHECIGGVPPHVQDV